MKTLSNHVKPRQVKRSPFKLQGENALLPSHNVQQNAVTESREKLEKKLCRSCKRKRETNEDFLDIDP